MEKTSLGNIKKSSRQISMFGGINHKEMAQENEWYDLLNITNDEYPSIATKKDIFKKIDIESILENDVKRVLNITTDGNSIYVLYEQNYWSPQNHAQLVKISNGAIESTITTSITAQDNLSIKWFGTYLIIVPSETHNGFYVNSINFEEYGPINIRNELKSGTDPLNYISVTMCDEDGNTYENVKYGTKAPTEDLEDGLLFYNTQTKTLSKYWEAQEGFFPVNPKTKIMYALGHSSTTYTQLIGKLREGDYVTLTGFEQMIESTIGKIIKLESSGYDSFIVLDIPPIYPDAELEYQNYSLISSGEYTGGTAIIERKIPTMDFSIESGNRLWGCYSGSLEIKKYRFNYRSWLNGHKRIFKMESFNIDTENSIVNEIYASKLGDFKNFNSYAGLSTDSYTLSLGSIGAFTGATTYEGYPYFFKENSIVMIYGNYPANYQLKTYDVQGIKKGCENSLCVCEGSMYYISDRGLERFNGNNPICVSDNISDVIWNNPKAAVHFNKIYISSDECYVYDVEKQMWTRENKENITEWYYNYAGTIGKLIDLDFYCNKECGAVFEEEEKTISWEMITPKIGFEYDVRKYISKLKVRMRVPEESNCSISIRYDDEEDFTELDTYMGVSSKSLNITIPLRRCDYFQIKFSGTGEFKLLTLTKEIEEGSDTDVYR
jgi:hypothetical protein